MKRTQRSNGTWLCDVLAHARLTAPCMCLMTTDALNPPQVATCIQTVADSNSPAHDLTRFPFESITPVNKTPKYLFSHNSGECREGYPFRLHDLSREEGCR